MKRQPSSAIAEPRPDMTVLDTLQTFETPEGVELGLRLAGPAPRALAWLIDGIIKLVLLSLASVMSLFGEFGAGLLLIYLFSILWLYNVLFEVHGGGSTPGKKVLGLRVVNANGTPVGWYGAVLRNLVRVVDSLPALYGIGVVSCLLNSRFQRLGDIAAGTVVVHVTERAHTPVEQTEPPLAPAMPLSLDDQRWILAFCERGRHLTEERAVELAEILEPLTGENGAAAVAKLHANGNWLAGRS